MLLPVAGETFNVEVRGSGRPLVLLHGFPLDHTMWEAQLEFFSTGWRVIAPDLRGFGSSVVTPGQVTMEQMADDCRGLLDALEIAGPVTLCGLSMGGYVAWQFARKYPDRLSRLVQCDTRAIADSPEAAANRQKLAEHVLSAGTEALAVAMLPKLFAPTTAQQRPEVVKAVRAMIAMAPPAGAAAAQSGMAVRPDVTAELAGIRVPTLLVVGAHDAISPPDEMRAIAQAIAGARLQVIEEAGHMAPMEQPAEVNRAIAEFLAV
ncbi:MAG TPA: alpha/beta fold hydrolase [Pirellulales bacterium]|jgi:3-oxoadipate enol-lactonase|nr:alpha/beta fold hydrolase [Pirellulales bacterium]